MRIDGEKSLSKRKLEILEKAICRPYHLLLIAWREAEKLDERARGFFNEAELAGESKNRLRHLSAIYDLACALKASAWRARREVAGGDGAGV